MKQNKIIFYTRNEIIWWNSSNKTIFPLVVIKEKEKEKEKERIRIRKKIMSVIQNKRTRR